MFDLHHYTIYKVCDRYSYILNIFAMQQNQKQFSEKLYKQTLKAVTEISECCDKYENEDEDDEKEKLLYNQVNHYYLDLGNVILNLQKIVNDISKNVPSAITLQSVLDEFNKITSSVQEPLKLEPKNLKSKLKADIVIVGFQTERLLKIIELDDAREYNQRILDCQLYLVIYTEKLKISMQYCNVTPAQSEKCLHDFVDTLSSILIQLKTGHPVVEKDLWHYVRRNVQYIQCSIDYISQLKTTGRFKKSLEKTLSNLETLGEDFTGLDALESDLPVQKFLANIEKFHDIIASGMGELQTGIGDAVQKSVNGKVKKLTPGIIVLYLFTGALNIFQSINNTLADVFMEN